MSRQAKGTPITSFSVSPPYRDLAPGVVARQYQSISVLLQSTISITHRNFKTLFRTNWIMFSTHVKLDIVPRLPQSRTIVSSDSPASYNSDGAGSAFRWCHHSHRSSTSNDWSLQGKSTSKCIYIARQENHFSSKESGSNEWLDEKSHGEKKVKSNGIFHVGFSASVCLHELERLSFR